MKDTALKITSFLLLIEGVTKLLLSVMLMIFLNSIIINNEQFTSSDFFLNLLYGVQHNRYPIPFVSHTVLANIFLIVYISIILILLSSIFDLIIGSHGLTALNGINFARTRILGTISLLIGICNLIDNIFLSQDSFMIYNSVHVIQMSVFLYCLNSISAQKRGRVK